MIRIGRLILIVAACGIFATIVRAENPPLTPQQLKANAQAELKKETLNLPSLGERDLHDVITFTIHDGKLIPATGLDLTGTQSHTLSFKNMPGVARVEVIGSQSLHLPGDEKFIQLQYDDLSVPDTVVVQTQVLSSPDMVQVAQDFEMNDGSTRSIQLIQAAAEGPTSVNLYVQTVPANDAGGAAPLHLTASSIPELFRLHPEETTRYLRPMFQTLHQEHQVFRIDDRTAWEVLADHWTPDAKTAASVQNALARLGADAYTEREDATADLQKLGEPAALCLMRTDRKSFSLEQAARVDMFLTPYRPLPDEQARKLQTDADFLTDCLYSDDATLRRMALEQLRKTTKKPLEFDLKLEGAARDAAVDKFRQDQATPTTRQGQ